MGTLLPRHRIRIFLALAAMGVVAQGLCAQETPTAFEGTRGVVVEDLSPQETPPQAAVASPTIKASKLRIPSGPDRVAIDLFEPAGEGPFPAVVVLHGTHGPRRGEKYYLAMSEDLARHGYVSLFLRFYDRGRKNKSRGNRAQWSASIGHALDYLETRPNVNPAKMGLLGYSQGAFMSLNYAPSDKRVQAIAALYGGLSPGFFPAAREHMPPTLLLHGTADRIVRAHRSLETHTWLRANGWDSDLVIYPTVGHGFTLHERGGWDEVAGDDAWQRTLRFLDFQLKFAGWRPERNPEGEARRPILLPLAPIDFALGQSDPTAADPSPLSLPPLIQLPHLEQAFSDKGRDFVLINPDAATVRALEARDAAPRKKGSGNKGGRGRGGSAKKPAAKKPVAGKPAAPPPAKPTSKK